MSAPPTDQPAAADAAAFPVAPSGRRSLSPHRIVLGVVLSAAALYAPWFFLPDMNKVLAQAVYLAIAAMGLNLLTGYNGQISIGHGAFFGVGAFTTAILMIDYGWMFEATIPVAALTAAALGVLVGIPALRVRGLYLALITLGLAVLFPRLAGRLVGSPSRGATWEGNGGVALLRPPRKSFDSLLSFLENDQWQYYLCLAIAVVLYLAAWNVIRSRVGRAMIATRDQELAAATVGVNLARVKVSTFAMSAAYAGVAGSLSVMVERAADGTNPVVYFQRSIEFLVAVVIGGAATVLGPAVGALALVILRRAIEEWLPESALPGSLADNKALLSPFFFGAGLIAIVFVLPEGLVGGFKKLEARFFGRSSDPPASLPPPEAPAADTDRPPVQPSVPPESPDQETPQ